MNRAKSSVSLRKLANSLKQSIYLDQYRAQKKEFIPLRSSASTVNLVNYNNPKVNFNEQQYLIEMDAGKSRFTAADAVKRQSNFSSLGYNVKNSQPLVKNKYRIFQIAHNNSRNNFITALPASNTIRQAVDFKQSQQFHAISILQKQYNSIREKLQSSYFNFQGKLYTKSLSQVDLLTVQLNQISLKQRQFLQHFSELKNRFLFLSEEKISNEMNFIENLAEKQYCEEFLQKYLGQNNSKSQFKDQAKYVIQMIQKQYQNKFKIDEEKQKLEMSLDKIENQFKLWKKQENLQFKQKKFDNKFKDSRIQLMKIEQDLDEITQNLLEKIKNENLSEHGIRKVRQFICAYFKKYNQLNINHISHGEIADGIDIFLCKQGLIRQFSQFINEKTEKICLTNGIYALKLSQYCDCLKKIQSLFFQQKNELNQLLTNKFQQKIMLLKQQIQKLSIKKEQNLIKIQDSKQSIQKILAQDSLSIIQYLNKNQEKKLQTDKNDGFFNISQIKLKVKALKLQQSKRISKVREIYFRLKKIEQKQLYSSQQNNKKQQLFQKQAQIILKDIKQWQLKIVQVRQIKNGYEAKKQKSQKMIDQAIQRMKQKDQAEASLVALQKQIKKLRDRKIQTITQKHQNKAVYNFKLTQSVQSKMRKIDHLNIAERTKSIWNNYQIPKNNEEDFKIAMKTANCQNIINQPQQKTNSAELGLTKKYSMAQFPKNISKLKRNAQSTSKDLKQVGPKSNLFFQKYNFNQAKLGSQTFKRFKKSASSFQLGTLKRQRKVDDLLLQSKNQSSKVSLKSKDQLLYKKSSSLSKTLKQSNFNSNRTSGIKPKNNNKSDNKAKLSLNQKFNEKDKQNNKQKQEKTKKFQKTNVNKSNIKNSNINSIISNKLLQR